MITRILVFSIAELQASKQINHPGENIFLKISGNFSEFIVHFALFRKNRTFSLN